MKNIKTMVRIIAVLLVINQSCATSGGNDIPDALSFDPKMKFSEKTLVFHDGGSVKYRAYEKIYYAANVEDSAYQYLNVYVPESAWENSASTPIFLKNNIGGYMVGRASDPANTDASGRALREGYVVVIPGARGWNSAITPSGDSVEIAPNMGGDGQTAFPDNIVYTGRAPAALLDLKAAVRYLRHNNAVMPGDAERIISDGTSAGGAMSALLGATGNNPSYEPYLRAMGVADERDDIFAVVSFCPITDLEHTDAAYEWLYNRTNTKVRALRPDQIAVSNELADLYPEYLNKAGLKRPDGTVLTDTNYLEYLKSFLIRSAQKARDAGMDIPVDTGVKLDVGFRGTSGEFVLDIDLETYLSYVAARQSLKNPPAFDSMGVLSQVPSFENNVFGDEMGSSANFTAYSLRKATGDPAIVLDEVMIERVRLMNPINFIGDSVTSVAPFWYIRHGAADRDTSFQIAVNLYTKLVNAGMDVDFALPWNRGHQGDYDLNNLFAWIGTVVNKK
jgi:hypothetical protein